VSGRIDPLHIQAKSVNGRHVGVQAQCIACNNINFVYAHIIVLTCYSTRYLKNIGLNPMVE
jgi:hypothetical protein